MQSSDMVLMMSSKPGHSKVSGSARLRRKLWRAEREMVCNWCHIDLTLEEATVDHLVAKADGGKSNVENLVWSCEPCNGKRGRERWLLNKPSWCKG